MLDDVTAWSGQSTLLNVHLLCLAVLHANRRSPSVQAWCLGNGHVAPAVAAIQARPL